MCDTAHMFPYHHSRDTRQFAYHMFLDPIGTLIVLLSPLHMPCCHIILLETSHTSNLGTLYKATQVYSLLSFSYSLASRALSTMRELHGCRARCRGSTSPSMSCPAMLRCGAPNTCSTAVNPFHQVTSPPPSCGSTNPICFPVDGIERADFPARRATRPSPTRISHNHMHPAPAPPAVPRRRGTLD